MIFPQLRFVVRAIACWLVPAVCLGPGAGECDARDQRPGSTAAVDRGGGTPNVVVLLADDLAWGDLARHGGPTPTPQIDRFFEQGVALRTFMVTPVCSPTRAGLLTGRHPVRVGIAPFVINPDTGAHLRAEELTLAGAFKAGGYATACIGKWHLGNSPTPNEHGFELFYGNRGAAVDYFRRTRQRNNEPDWQENGRQIREEGYTTDLIRDRAVRYIRDQESGGRPFFLYVPFTAVHDPFQATPEYLARVGPGITDELRRTYAAMIMALDDAVGAILQAIADRGIERETIVFFASDNGGVPMANNAPFRGGKHSLYEGGVRSPTAIRWTGRLEPGRRTDALLAVVDLYPTLLSLAGVTRPEGPPLDGRDFSGVLLEDAPSPREFYCWIWRDCDAIRTHRWKLLRRWNRRELYDLEADPAEARDVSADHPQVAADLEDKLNAWAASIPAYPSHVPIRSAAGDRPEPQGDVLEIRVRGRRRQRADQAAGDRPLSVLLARSDLILQPGDRLEYDMLIPEGYPSKGWLLANPGGRPQRAVFDATMAVDQYGTLQNLANGFPQAEGRWARRVIGLANRVPRPLGAVSITFAADQPADYHLYLDNLVIRRAGGEIIELYRDGPLQRDGAEDRQPAVSIRAVPLSEVPG